MAMTRAGSHSLKVLRSFLQPNASRTRTQLYSPFFRSHRSFHNSTPWLAIKTHRLTDIGEGTKEVQIIQWFVEEGARVEEWGKLCEVQSDKAAVEITSKYEGVIKKLYFEKDAIVQVGDAMVDIEVEGAEEEVPEEHEAHDEAHKDEGDLMTAEMAAEGETLAQHRETEAEPPTPAPAPATQPKPPSKHASLATPAVRGLLKQHGIAIEDVHGTGKDGRVLKEDVIRYVAEGDSRPAAAAPAPAPQPQQQPEYTYTPPSIPGLDAVQTETSQNLTPIQSAMFKAMTASLSIPHFLYSDTANITALSSLRTSLNSTRDPNTTPKLSYLPFIIKAVSLALQKYPLLNARVDPNSPNPKAPRLLMRSGHNIGIAMDTAQGLLVPVIKNVQARSILSIAHEIARLSHAGRQGKLTTADLSGGTITVSNIGNIGGETVAPVIVEGQLAILGVGKVRSVPVFKGKEGLDIERADMVGLSWSADHRVVDGATMARMAQIVQSYLENPASMMVDMS